jgi:hypothetical protein
MSNPISATTRARFGASIVALAPTVMLAGLFAHPYIATLPDEAAVAEAVAADTTYWGLVHLTAAVASGLLVLAFLTIRSYLREAGEERWSILALPFIVMGSTLFAVLPGMEFAPLAAAKVGADAEAAQAALASWFIPIMVTGASTFAVGVFAFAKGIANSRVLSRRLTWVVVGALVVLAISRVVPVGAAQFYVQGAAGVVALWPLAYEMWKRPEAARPAGQPRPMPAA